MALKWGYTNLFYLRWEGEGRNFSFFPECGTTQFSLVLFVLYSCCSRSVAFVKLIHLNDLLDDVNFLFSTNERPVTLRQQYMLNRLCLLKIPSQLPCQLTRWLTRRLPRRLPQIAPQTAPQTVPTTTPHMAPHTAPGLEKV